jgi:CTP-dependent riboflavin kinase
MFERFTGRIQSGTGNASKWLSLFNAAYSAKTGMPVFPGSLNIALDHSFDWFATEVQQRTVWFGRDEYGGERDILLVPCVIESLEEQAAFLWTPTTAARQRSDPHVVELIAPVNLRATFGVLDGDQVSIRLGWSATHAVGR